MGFSFHDTERFEEEFGEAWERVQRRTQDHVLLDALFVGALLRHFGSERTVLAVSDSEGQPAMLLVERAHRGFWNTFQPSQAPLGLALLPRGGTGPGVVRAMLRDLPGYALALGVTQQDPDWSGVAGIAGGNGVETLPYIDTSRISVRGSFDEFWGTRSKNLTHNISRRRRRLEREGIRVELLVDRDAEAMESCVEEYGRLESAGWKGAAGTAVAPGNLQGRFYRHLVERYCELGRGVVYRLQFEGKTVACDLCVERDGMIVILKTTFDEAVREHSPGMLLHHEVFREIHERGAIDVIEFYGPVKDWHRRWTDEIRSMVHVNVYRGALVGRLHRIYRGRRGAK